MPPPAVSLEVLHDRPQGGVAVHPVTGFFHIVAVGEHAGRWASMLERIAGVSHKEVTI